LPWRTAWCTCRPTTGSGPGTPPPERRCGRAIFPRPRSADRPPWPTVSCTGPPTTEPSTPSGSPESGPALRRLDLARTPRARPPRDWLGARSAHGGSGRGIRVVRQQGQVRHRGLELPGEGQQQLVGDAAPCAVVLQGAALEPDALRE